MIAGIVFIILAIVFVIISCFQIEDSWPMVLVGVLSGFLASLGLILLFEDAIPEKTEFKYPIAEYTLEYEVVSRGEQIDSTYVITKLE